MAKVMNAFKARNHLLELYLCNLQGRNRVGSLLCIFCTLLVITSFFTYLQHWNFAVEIKTVTAIFSLPWFKLEAMVFLLGNNYYDLHAPSRYFLYFSESVIIWCNFSSKCFNHLGQEGCRKRHHIVEGTVLLLMSPQWISPITNMLLASPMTEHCPWQDHPCCHLFLIVTAWVKTVVSQVLLKNARTGTEMK